MRPAEIFERSHVEPGFQLFDGVAALPGEVEQELDLFRGRGGIGRRLLAVGGLVLLRCGLDGELLHIGHLPRVGGFAVQLGFHAVTNESKRFMDAGVELFGSKAVRQFHLYGRVVGLAAVFGVSRDFLGVGCVEFEHGLGSFQKIAPGNDELPRAVVLRVL